MTDQYIINPRTNRSITKGGPTHRRLIDEGVLPDTNLRTSPKRTPNSPQKDNIYNLLPKEMRDEIVYNTPIESIGVLCHLDQRFLEKCYDKNFWSTYIGGDQEKLHNLLIELAKQGDWTLFDFIWKTPLLKRERTKSGKVIYTEMIKEVRTLVEAYTEARLNNKIETADRIWAMEYIQLVQYFSHRFYNWKDDEELKSQLDLRMDLRLASQSDDMRNYMKSYKRTILELSNHDQRDAIIKSAKYAQNYDIFIFIINLIGDDDFGYQVVEDQLREGRVEYVERLLQDKRFSEVYAVWRDLFSSSHPEPLNIIQKYRPDITEISPESVIDVGLGNPKILIEYAYKYARDPDLATTLMDSYRTLPAKDFVKLYKNTVKCVNKLDLKNNVSIWKKEGYDYLVDLFTKEVPICTQ